MRVIHLHPEAPETNPFVFTHPGKRKQKLQPSCSHTFCYVKVKIQKIRMTVATQATKSLTSLHLLPKYKDGKLNFYLFCHSFKFHGHRVTHCGASLISITFCISKNYCHRNTVQVCTS